MKNIFKLILFVICIFSSFSMAFASNEGLEKKELIFVIDASNSMKSFDKENIVLDEAKKIANVLTSEYKVGVVVYNTVIVDYANLNDDLLYFNSILDRTKYIGYTNAGEALQLAIGMFSENARFKNIIMISDGEIVLQNETLTNKSNEKFENAINICKEKNVVVDIIAIGKLTEDGKRFNIFRASELTNGQIFKVDNILKLSEISKEILFNKLKIKRSQVGVGNTLNGELNLTLETKNLDKAKILLSSKDMITNINVNCKAEIANIINGKNFAIVEIIEPYEKNINLKFNTNDKLEAYLIQEVNAKLSGNMEDYTYENNKVLVKLNLSLKNDRGNIFNDSYYENKNITLKVNDEIYDSLIENGGLNILLDTSKFKEELNISLNLGNLEQNFININSINLKLDKNKIDEIIKLNKKDYKLLPLYIILITLLIIISFVIFKSYSIKKEKLEKVEIEKNLFNKKNPYTYSGKLNIYVINMANGEDIPPQTFNLQRKESNEKLKLKEILNACKINLVDESSKNIVFEPMSNKALGMTNNSYATIIKNGSLVTFEKSVNINFNEKISIILEDEVTELEIHYKSLKPSEIHNYI